MRISAELLGGLSALAHAPDLNVLMFHGPLVYALTDTMRTRFADVFNAASRFIVDDKAEMRERAQWLGAVLGDSPSLRFGLTRDMWLIGHWRTGELCLQEKDDDLKRQLVEWGWSGFDRYPQTDKRTLEGIARRVYRAAAALGPMERTSRTIARDANPLPLDRKELVRSRRSKRCRRVPPLPIRRDTNRFACPFIRGVDTQPGESLYPFGGLLSGALPLIVDIS